jgi:hypothetical protein
VISEESIREQNEWLAKEKADWKKHKGERWRGKATADRENEGQDNQRRTQKVERKTRQAQTTTTACPRSAPPPPVHPESVTAQLGLTPEEAQAIHKEGVRAQEEIQTEEEDRARCEQPSRECTTRTPHYPYTPCTTRQATTTRTSCHSITTRSPVASPAQHLEAM